jgi:hypothetical protein
MAACTVAFSLKRVLSNTFKNKRKQSILVDNKTRTDRNNRVKQLFYPDILLLGELKNKYGYLVKLLKLS